MTSTSINVNISGINTEVKLEEIEINKIFLDQDNPRIGFYRDAQPFSDFTQEHITHALSNKNPDAYSKLKENIEINEGIVNPIWVEPKQDGTYLVLEGNTRLLIYRELSEKYITKDVYKKILCRVLPQKISDDQRNFIKLEAHLRGTTPWDAYEKARYLFYLWNQEGYSKEQLAKRTKLTTDEITQFIDAFKDMEQQYLPKYTDPSEVLKFSFFMEYEKNKKLKREMERNALTLSDFCEWVGERKIPKAQDVRELRHLIENEESRKVFIKDGFEYAQEILGTIKPEIISPLFQNIEKIIEDLKGLSNYEIVQMQDGDQPMKKQMILDLRKEVNDFVYRYFNKDT